MISTNQRCLLACFLAILSFAFAHSTLAATVLNGVATYTELGQEQYIAGLYTSNLSKQQKDILIDDNEKEIQVRILADSISSRSFKKMWIEGLAINASSRELEAQSQNMADFTNMLKIRLLRGDIFTVRRSTKDVVVLLNGATVGTINDTKFFDVLIRAWIGPVPLSTEFREALLAGGEMDSKLVTRFQTTQPSAARIAAITAGLEAIAGNAAAAAPTLAAAAPKTEPKAAPKAAPKPTQAPKIAAPKVVAPKIEAPKPVKKVAKVEKPAEPPQLFFGPSDGALLDSSIFDVTEDDVEYTAETLLAQQLFIAKLKKWSQRFIKYPISAQKRGQQGNVRLNVTIDRDGKVKDVEVLEAAKFDVLTIEAQDAVNRATPFPRMPTDIPGELFTFSIPVAFVLLDD